MGQPLDLGCFSVSLAVQDLAVSKRFYGALGFTVLGGGDGYDAPSDEGKFPGQLDEFTDVRVIEQRLLAAGIELTRSTESDSGPTTSRSSTPTATRS